MIKSFKTKAMSVVGLSSAALLALSMTAAQATATATGYVRITQIKAIPGASGSGLNNIFIGTTTAWPNTDGCTNTTYIIVENSEANYNLLMTMLYDAYANGDTVNFTLNGCVQVGSPTYPIVTAFFLQKS